MLQESLLSSVSTLCVQLAVSSHEVETLAHSCLPYLSAEQPQGLQDVCMTTFGNLIGYDPDIIWLLLQQVCPNTVTHPNNGILKQYYFGHGEKSDVFSSNVYNLLTLFK